MPSFRGSPGPTLLPLKQPRPLTVRVDRFMLWSEDKGRGVGALSGLGVHANTMVDNVLSSDLSSHLLCMGLFWGDSTPSLVSLSVQNWL